MEKSKMIFIKIAIALTCSALFWWGGYSWHNARRFILPSVLVGMLFILTGTFWCLLSLSVIGAFCLGYGEKSPLRHIFGDGWGRFVWGLLSASCISVPVLCTGHLAWYFFVGYLALCSALEDVLKDVPQSIGDPIIGLAFGSILFLVH